MAEKKNSSSEPPSSSPMDPYEFLKIAPNPDGSLTRLSPLPSVPPPPDAAGVAAAFKDRSAGATSVRIFRPPSPSPAGKIPLIIYFHGGGFILFSATALPFHESCRLMASLLPALIVSVEYRLAPENRLPAAYDDAVSAVLWARDQALGIDPDPWMTSDSVDFSNCFLMGSSSGANIAYHAAVRALDLDISPLRIAGLILNQPYFGGAERTPSERDSAVDRILPLRANDLMWALALPEGADRDHEYCNPTSEAASPWRDRVGRLPPCLIAGHEGDPLIDRQRGFAGMLGSRGVHVESMFETGGHHAAELFDASKAQNFYGAVKKFVTSITASAAAKSSI